MSLIRRFICKIRGQSYLPNLLKQGLKVGKNLSIQPDVIIDNSHCWLISIGDNVTIAPRVHIIAHDASSKQYLGYTRIARVSIGNLVFIGAGCTILPGVTIGNNVIIGAGSVVTHDIPNNCVYVGNPARFLVTIDDYIHKGMEKLAKMPIDRVQLSSQK